MAASDFSCNFIRILTSGFELCDQLICLVKNANDHLSLVSGCLFGTYKTALIKTEQRIFVAPVRKRKTHSM